MAVTHPLVSVNDHVSVYRGFTIQVLPRSLHFKNKRYQVTKDGSYFGQEFAQAEAVKLIDKLHHDNEVWSERLIKGVVTNCTEIKSTKI